MAVQLWRRGRHSVSTAHVDTHAIHGVERFASWLNASELRSTSDFNTLVDGITHLARQHARTNQPMVIHVRMDGYPALSCAQWVLAREITHTVIPAIELRQPTHPAYVPPFAYLIDLIMSAYSRPVLTAQL